MNCVDWLPTNCARASAVKQKNAQLKKSTQVWKSKKCNSKYSTGSQTTQKYAKEHQSKIKCKKSKSYKNSKKKSTMREGKVYKKWCKKAKGDVKGGLTLFSFATKKGPKVSSAK